MNKNKKRYHSLNLHLRQKFCQKTIKISVDAGFSCPSRCIYCSGRGSGDFTAGSSSSLSEQFLFGRNLLNNKWPNSKVIIYFQAFTNTYASTNTLLAKYNEALELPGVCGIAIATRPDCLADDVLDVLSYINKKTYLWVELGFQTSNEKTAEWINRGYSNEVFTHAVEKLKARGIETVCHLIFGFPNENKNDFIASAKFVAQTGINGVKIQMLNVLKDTVLGDYYNASPFPLLTQNEYVSAVTLSLCYLPGSIVIHRLTGDGDKNLLIAPQWIKNKRGVLNAIDKEFFYRQTVQGSCTNSPWDI